MTKRMLIDALHQEETRVATIDASSQLLEFDFSTKTKKTIKSNIYLAKVAKVEPSLQAAFIDYGGDRHGFLAFGEIHPDYFRIPMADRQVLQEEMKKISEDSDVEETFDAETPEEPADAEEAPESRQFARSLAKLHRRYKIQEVLQKGQILLVQVIKEERGNKGAALTTFLSLPGRYCVLMPNSPRNGGVSRKIANQKDRARLRKSLDALKLPQGMGLIVRTAGKDRTRTEIRRDAEYLMRLWNDIRQKTLSSVAPSLVYTEDDIIKRSIRDMYSKEVDEILVSGEEGYKTARTFMKTLMPSHVKKIKLHKEEDAPLFHTHGIERQIESIYDTTVYLPSGGSIVIHPTEALVSIDVNSGRATRERNIEETAFKTNMEAASEVARQARLRGLAGLIVIDFIDMDETRNIHAVERRVKDSFKNDRARVQVGRISSFSLMELSRQRLGPSLMELSGHVCESCHGTGYIRSTETMTIHLLRTLEKTCLDHALESITVHVHPKAAYYLFNEKRQILQSIEDRYKVRLHLQSDETLQQGDYHLISKALETQEPVKEGAKEVKAPGRAPEEKENKKPDAGENSEKKTEDRGEKNRRRNRRRKKEAPTAVLANDKTPAKPEPLKEEQPQTTTSEAKEKSPRKSQQQRRRMKNRAKESVPDAGSSEAHPQEGKGSDNGHEKPSLNEKNREDTSEKVSSKSGKKHHQPNKKKGDDFSMTPVELMALSPSLHAEKNPLEGKQPSAEDKSSKTWWRRILNGQTPK